jgi:hypothetical protein
MDGPLSTRSTRCLTAGIDHTVAGRSQPRPTNEDPESPKEIPMTPVLVVLTFLLLLDVLVLLDGGHDSRDGRDWQPRRSSSPHPATVALV